MSRNRWEEYPRSNNVTSSSRLARGEIDSEEFDEIRSRLEYHCG